MRSVVFIHCIYHLVRFKDNCVFGYPCRAWGKCEKRFRCVQMEQVISCQKVQIYLLFCYYDITCIYNYLFRNVQVIINNVLNNLMCKCVQIFINWKKKHWFLFIVHWCFVQLCCTCFIEMQKISFTYM